MIKVGLPHFLNGRNGNAKAQSSQDKDFSWGHPIRKPRSSLSTFACKSQTLVKQVYGVLNATLTASKELAL
jgi:hypothetical protein